MGTTHTICGDYTVGVIETWHSKLDEAVFKDNHTPPAVCSNAPSSAGMAKWVTFTTSLLDSSCSSQAHF